MPPPIDHQQQNRQRKRFSAAELKISFNRS
jgi:hypothetical protein